MSFTVTRVAYSDAASGSNTVLTTGSALPLGSFLVAFVASGGGGATVGLTDSKSNTWTQQQYATNANSPASTVAIFTTTVTTALTSSDTLTGTSSAGSGCGDIELLSVTVNQGTISVVGGSTGTGNSGTPGVTSFTPGSKNLVIAALVESSNVLESGSTAGTGFTKLTSLDTPARSRAVVGQYGVPGAATTAAFTLSVSQQYAAAAIELNQSVPVASGFDAEFARDSFVGTTTTTRNVPVTHAVAAGDFAILAVNVPAGGGTNTTCTVTDPHGNTWTKRQNAVNGPGNGQPFLITCPITTPLTTSDTLTVTVNFGSTVWEVLGVAFTGITAYDKGAANNGASSKTVDSGTTAAGAQDSQLLVAAFGYGGTSVTLTGIPAGFTEQAVQATTGTIRNMQVIWGFVNAPGTRGITATMSDNASHAWAGCIVVMNANLPAATHTAFIDVGGTWVACDRGLWISGAWSF